MLAREMEGRVGFGGGTQHPMQQHSVWSRPGCRYTDYVTGGDASSGLFCARDARLPDSIGRNKFFMSISDCMSRAGAASQARRRLDNTLNAAPVLEFDDHSRLVFFSDLHRGDNGPADAFRPNRALFLSALGHYEREGYSYVEVGDGDELWKNRDLAQVRIAHRPVYRIMERLREAGRLTVLVGNHQLVRMGRRLAVAAPEFQEAVLLKHRDRGTQVLVTHGHQADSLPARAYGVVRLAVRYFWRYLQSLGLPTALPDSDEPLSVSPILGALIWSRHNQASIENRIAGWLAKVDHLAIICGHTHRPAFAAAGALPYYNTGSGIQPGIITGLEIADGAISLVSWTNRMKEGPGAQLLRSGLVRRVVLAGPSLLNSI
jgi:UDP-2,3-diacylglucosamine pyrophosphatase LpxH